MGEDSDSKLLIFGQIVQTIIDDDPKLVEKLLLGLTQEEAVDFYENFCPLDLCRNLEVFHIVENYTGTKKIKTTVNGIGFLVSIEMLHNDLLQHWVNIYNKLHRGINVIDSDSRKERIKKSLETLLLKERFDTADIITKFFRSQNITPSLSPTFWSSLNSLNDSSLEKAFSLLKELDVTPSIPKGAISPEKKKLWVNFVSLCLQ